MNIFLDEICTTPNSTLSLVFMDNKTFCFSIEDGYREQKVPGETRIPGGRYQVVRRTTGKIFEQYKKQFKHEFSLEIKDVPGFTDVLIHIGNTRQDTAGCILVNRGASLQPDGDMVGIDSTSVYKQLYTLVKKEYDAGREVWIEISRRPVVNENEIYG